MDFGPLGAEHRRRMARELPEGNGPFFPIGFAGVLKTLPFAVWLFLAIEQLPLAAEESVDPKKDMPRGIILGMLTLIISAFMIVLLNPVGRRRRRSFKLGHVGEPLLDGFRAIYGERRGGAAGHRGAHRADRELPHHPLRAWGGRSTRCRARATSPPRCRSRCNKAKTPLRGDDHRAR